VKVRTNFKDEIRKKLQCTMFLCCNEFPKVDPPDAYETLEVINFPTKFVDEATYNSAASTSSDTQPRHWRLQDPNIKNWLASDAVVGAFIHIVLRAYETVRRAPPQCVTSDTANFKGASCMDISERIREVVLYSPNANDKAFTGQIKIHLEKAGMESISPYKIEEYIRRLYGHHDFPPERKQYIIDRRRGYGYNHIKLADVDVFDARIERSSQIEQRKEEARLLAKRKHELDGRDTNEYHQDFLQDTREEFKTKDAATYRVWLERKRARVE
jgi:hypothetical protein